MFLKFPGYEYDNLYNCFICPESPISQSLRQWKPNFSTLICWRITFPQRWAIVPWVGSHVKTWWLGACCFAPDFSKIWKSKWFFYMIWNAKFFICNRPKTVFVNGCLLENENSPKSGHLPRIWFDVETWEISSFTKINVIQCQIIEFLRKLAQ